MIISLFKKYIDAIDKLKYVAVSDLDVFNYDDIKEYFKFVVEDEIEISIPLEIKNEILNYKNKNLSVEDIEKIKNILNLRRKGKSEMTLEEIKNRIREIDDILRFELYSDLSPSEDADLRKEREMLEEKLKSISAQQPEKQEKEVTEMTLEEIHKEIEDISRRINSGEIGSIGLDEWQNLQARLTELRKREKELKQEQVIKPVTPISSNPETNENTENKPKKVIGTKIKEFAKNHKKLLIAAGITAITIGVIVLAIHLGPAITATKMVANGNAWFGASKGMQDILHLKNIFHSINLAQTAGHASFEGATGIWTFGKTALEVVKAKEIAKVVGSAVAIALGGGALTAGIKVASPKFNEIRNKLRKKLEIVRKYRYNAEIIDKEKDEIVNEIETSFDNKIISEKEYKRLWKIVHNIDDVMRNDGYIREDRNDNIEPKKREIAKEKGNIFGFNNNKPEFKWDDHYQDYGLEYGPLEESQGRGR